MTLKLLRTFLSSEEVRYAGRMIIVAALLCVLYWAYIVYRIMSVYYLGGTDGPFLFEELL